MFRSVNAVSSKLHLADAELARLPRENLPLSAKL
jgi:hypothetical protein